MENMNTCLMTVDELCEALLIGKNTAYKLLTSGALKGFRIGKIWKIPKNSLKEFILQQTNRQLS